MSDHSEGRPSDEGVTEAPASQKKRSSTPNRLLIVPVDDLSSLSQSFHSFTEDNAELGDVS